MSGLLKVWQVDTKEEVWSFEAGDLEVRSSEWDSILTSGRGKSFGGSSPTSTGQAYSEPIYPKVYQECLYLLPGKFLLTP
jgi:hypothetical protein